MDSVVTEIGVVVVALLALVGTVLQLLFGKGKNKAETESVTVTTALSMMGEMKEQIGELRNSATTNAQKIEEEGRWRRLMLRRVDRHSLWDLQVVSQLRAQGLTIEDPPPLDDPSEGVAERTRSTDFPAPGARRAGDPDPGGTTP